LLAYVGHWSLLGFGYWAVEEKASEAYVGDIGFANFKRDVEPSIGEAPEAGWALAPRAHGKGYATEALARALAWGEARFSGARTVCLIHPDNLASLRVAEKTGFREYARGVSGGEHQILLSRGG